MQTLYFNPKKGRAWSFDDEGIKCDGIEYDRGGISEITHVKPGFGQDGVISFKYKGETITLYYRGKENPSAAVVVGILKNADEKKKYGTTEELYYRCNICGHIFCYTYKDIHEKNKTEALNALSAIGMMSGAVSGQWGGAIANQNNIKEVTDYSKCPKCNSRSIQRISKTEAEQNSGINKTTTALSVPDEIRKYKELLDEGIITQEEFVEKKKQLLGL